MSGKFTLIEFITYDKIVKLIVGLLSRIFSSLKFGGVKSIDLSKIRMISEESKKDKGNNGLLAEYECSYVLANKLNSVGLKVNSDINGLKSLRDEKVKFYGAGLTTDEIKRAKNQGVAIAESIFESIVNNGQDFIFTE